MSTIIIDRDTCTMVLDTGEKGDHSMTTTITMSGFNFGEMPEVSPKGLRVLSGAAERGSTHSGRGGWDKGVMLALERRGLVVRGKQWTHELDWKLTALGRALGRASW